MDTRTGEMLTEAQVGRRLKKRPQDAQHYREIPKEHLGQMQAMTRAERRRYAKANNLPMWEPPRIADPALTGSKP